MVPLYILFSRGLGWGNSFWPLIVPPFSAALSTSFSCASFFMTLPPELEDAARVDGASTLQTLWHVILPASRPAIATVAVFPFRRSGTIFCLP